jgi:hypothetical protein
VIALTDKQVAFLEALVLRPHGAVIRGEEQVRILFTLEHSGLLCNVYELPRGGEYTARLTQKGRAFLAERKD